MSSTNPPHPTVGPAIPSRPPRILKRYPNRKLYDIRDSCYVTLEEIADIVRDGEAVRVFDSRTHEDLTSVTLAQIIYEQEKKRSQMPLELLLSMVRYGGAQIGGHIQAGAQQVSSKAEAALRWVKLGKRAQAAAAQKTASSPKSQSDVPVSAHAAASPSDASPHPEAARAGSRAKAAAETASDNGGGKGVRSGKVQQSIGEWHRELDTRVQNTIESLSSLPTLARELEVMERRIRELEAKLEDLDNS